jgi:membrane protease YdiL (CAAX protease family)
MKLFLKKLFSEKATHVPIQRVVMLAIIAGAAYAISRLVMAFNTEGNTTFLCLGTVDATGLGGLIVVISSIALSPLFEEYVFRKLLITWLSKYVFLNVAVLLSALLFATLHLQHWVDGIKLRDLLSIFIAGIVYGYVYLSRRSFFDSFLVHAFKNSLILIPKESLAQYCDVLTNTSVLTIALVLISLVILSIHRLKTLNP